MGNNHCVEVVLTTLGVSVVHFSKEGSAALCSKQLRVSVLNDFGSFSNVADKEMSKNLLKNVSLFIQVSCGDFAC